MRLSLATRATVDGSTSFRIVSPDEQWILYGESPARESELMLVENSR